MEPTDNQGPYQPRTPPMAEDDPVVQWLLQGDPAIRWQVLRDLVNASETEVATERARVEHEGWGARLLALRAPDGLWANGACFPDTAAFAAATARALAAGEPPPPWPSSDAEPAEAPTDGSSAEPGQPWTATYPVLLDLFHLGIPPDTPVMQETARLVARNCRWEYDGLPFFAGEVDCCINAGTILIGTYLGVDVDPVVRRLMADQMPDGGWNCWAETRPAPASFASTLDVIDALLRWERHTGGSEEVRRARRNGEEYLLRRNLFRSLRTGEVVNPEWASFSYPPRWHYDLLKATEYFARRGGIPDPRLTEAIERVRAKRQPDGRWLLENNHSGAVHFRFEEPDGAPSRWNTLRALRVLRWYGASAHSGTASQRLDDRWRHHVDGGS
ncbi:squalene cyclase [Kribbella sp. NBC_00359]|uniref:squalene cyclase n=1 Tax=Kribbella sp. NBC_00359 TaxID=2975966 RepID=UPI002E1ED8D8